MRVRPRGIQGVLRTRGVSLTQDGGRKGGKEQPEGSLPRAFGRAWILVLALSTCVTEGKSPNLSVPRFLIGKMGGMIATTCSGCCGD